MTATKQQPVNLIHRAFPALGASRCDLGRQHGNVEANLGSFGGGFDLRINPFLSLFAASLIALFPAHSFAQTTSPAAATGDNSSVRERDRPEYDPLGVRLGAFDLNATLDLGVASTDNLFAAADNTPTNVDDIIYTVNPTARLSSNWSRHSVSLDGGATWTKHADYDSEDTDQWFARAVGRLDIGDSSSLRGTARTGHYVTPRTDPDSFDDGVPVEYDRDDFSIGVTHRFSRAEVSLTAVQDEYEYDTASQVFRDNEINALRGRIAYELSPRLGIVVAATSDERDYKNTPALDSDGTSIMAGVSLNTDLMRGELTVGQFERDYTAADNFDGLAIAGNLEWYVTQLTTLTFTARRDADDQVGVSSGLPFVTEEFGARVDHELRRNIILTAAASIGEREYDTNLIDRNDDIREFEVGADYMLNRRVALRARYNYDEVESNGVDEGRDYDVNTVSVGLSLRL